MSQLKYKLPCVLSLQMVETEENDTLLATPGCKHSLDLIKLPLKLNNKHLCVISVTDVLLKLFMINLDDNEEDIDISQLVEIEIEENKLIRDLSDLLYAKFDISRESNLHFAVQNSSKPTILDNITQCSIIYTNYVRATSKLH